MVTSISTGSINISTRVEVASHIAADSLVIMRPVMKPRRESPGFEHMP